MFGYSLLRANANRGFFNALMDEMLAFRRADRGPAHRDRARASTKPRSSFRDALECADRGVLFKTGAKEIGAQFGIMPSFMAKWSQQYPGCSGHLHQSLSDGKKNLFYDAKGSAGMSKLFESYLAGQVACLMQFAPMFWPTINSYKRLVDGFWAPVKPTWAIDNRTASFRVIAGLAEEHAARDALPRCRHQPLPRGRGTSGRGAARRREESEADRQTDHRHQPGLRRHPARAALAEGDDRDLPAFRPSHATGSAISSSITSPRRESGNGASGRTR